MILTYPPQLSITRRSWKAWGGWTTEAITGLGWAGRLSQLGGRRGLPGRGRPAGLVGPCEGEKVTISSLSLLLLPPELLIMVLTKLLVSWPLHFCPGQELCSQCAAEPDPCPRYLFFPNLSVTPPRMLRGIGLPCSPKGPAAFPEPTSRSSPCESSTKDPVNGPHLSCSQAWA